MFLPRSLIDILKRTSALRKSGNADEAIKILEGLEQDESLAEYLPTIWCNLGDCYLREKHDVLTAIEYYKKTLQGNPDDPYAYMGLGTSFVKLKDYGAAITYLTEGLRRNPGNPHIAGLLGRVRARDVYHPPTPPLSHTDLPLGQETPSKQNPSLVTIAQSGGLKEGLYQQIEDNPRNVGARQMLMRLLVKESDITGAQEQATLILGVDEQNSEAKQFLRRHPVEEQSSPVAQVATDRGPRVHTLSGPFRAAVDKEGDACTPGEPLPSTPVPGQLVTLRAVEEWELTIQTGNEEHTITFLLPASGDPDAPLRIELVDPARGEGGKGFVVAREIKHSPES